MDNEETRPNDLAQPAETVTYPRQMTDEEAATIKPDMPVLADWVNGGVRHCRTMRLSDLQAASTCMSAGVTDRRIWQLGPGELLASCRNEAAAACAVLSIGDRLTVTYVASMTAMALVTGILAAVRDSGDGEDALVVCGQEILPGRIQGIFRHHAETEPRMTNATHEPARDAFRRLHMAVAYLHDGLRRLSHGDDIEQQLMMSRDELDGIPGPNVTDGRVRVIYLAGPLRGRDCISTMANIDRAGETAQVLLGRGYAVICTHLVYAYAVPFAVPSAADYDPGGFVQRVCLPLLERADAVGVMPGWEGSTGSRIEVAYAHAIGRPVWPVDQLRGPDLPLPKPIPATIWPLTDEPTKG